jgi:hypothetical protein
MIVLIWERTPGNAKRRIEERVKKGDTHMEGYWCRWEDPS